MSECTADCECLEETGNISVKIEGICSICKENPAKFKLDDSKSLCAKCLGDVMRQAMWADKKRKRGRNEPCHCGSGKKFKKCHLIKTSEEVVV